LPPGKPWSLEEYPTRTEQGNAENQTPGSLSGWLDLALSAGGGGAMLWNITPEIDKQTFQFAERGSVLIELRNWVDRHLPTSP
jgi:endo-1,4-beta-mannosidase